MEDGKVFMLHLFKQRLVLQCKSVESWNSNKILTTKNAKSTETRTYGDSSLRSLCSLRLIHFWLRLAALGILRILQQFNPNACP